ncbi:MAG: GspE/PulE/PilB domain-containing protein [Thermodesulfovibrionales bacterium]
MMMTEKPASGIYKALVDSDIISGEALHGAEQSATARGVELQGILIREHGVSRYEILKTLSDHYHCPFVEYDEKLPVPPELLAGLDGERLSMSQWFPIIRDGSTVVIAAADPGDQAVREEAGKYIQAERYEFWVALGEDIQWFIQDFLHAQPGQLIGTERTGLAFWRNTMAQWRTRLACYRNDLAKARTDLAFLRWGLGFIALSDILMRRQQVEAFYGMHAAMIMAGISLAVFGLNGYYKIRRSRISPPGHHTLVEATAATLQFLENYHFIGNTGSVLPSKQTMLGRLGDFVASHCTILNPSPASRERTHLARERNVLAAQRTIAACYRTIYARSRTGLAFIRTGVSFAGLGLGLMHYFGYGPLTVIDALLIGCGALMLMDGLRWYLPVRKEQSEIPRCPVPE